MVGARRPHLRSDGGHNTATAVLRVINAILFVVCFVLIAVYLSNTRPDDYLRSWFDLFAVVAGAVVSSLGIILSIASGADIGARRKLWPWLQSLSRKPGILLSFLVPGISVACFFTYENLFFRNVEFRADEQVVLFLVDTPGDVRNIGSLEANKARDLRLRIGIHNIVGRQPITSEILITRQINVEPIWRSWAMEPVQLPVAQTKFLPAPASKTQGN